MSQPEAQPERREMLRRQFAKHGRPEQFEKILVCRKGHALLWLIPTDRGLAPIANLVGKGRFAARSLDDPQGPLMTLDQWPPGELLPRASCECHDSVETSLHEAKRWLGTSRRKFVYAG